MITTSGRAACAAGLIRLRIISLGNMGLDGVGKVPRGAGEVPWHFGGVLLPTGRVGWRETIGKHEAEAGLRPGIISGMAFL